MAKVWLTYAWDDNVDGDVDFIAQELRTAGQEVKLDRWNLGAGERLWEQIEAFIQDPNESDAWLFYATQNSLGSQPCKEEYAYALDRALNTRTANFPIIALFPGPVDRDLVPAGIRTRLYISLTDPDWLERVVAAVEGRQVQIHTAQLEPYVLTVHQAPAAAPRRLAIEMRPRAGAWVQFTSAVPLDEFNRVRPFLAHGARGRVPVPGVLFDVRQGRNPRDNWYIIGAGHEATPTMSYYLFCNELPSRLAFGVDGGAPQYVVQL